MKVKPQFGLRLPAFPIDGNRVPTFITQIQQYIADLVQYFDSAWACDHLIPWADFVPERTPNLEGFTTVSYLSGLYQNLTFGNIVLCNSYRNPALLAKMSATLQALTNGRFILGIGAGWKQDEYQAYGYEFPRPKIRIQQLNEAVQIIKKMWTEDIVTFEGTYYHIHEAICEPKPTPIPPILIGGGGEQLNSKLLPNTPIGGIPRMSRLKPTGIK
jgi:alkanesulfonate monooxygenase SsuD/methylene tetrahydromethanopterin reductase-like flavin-dependent oxidoreductase (luciferase family)